jgi:hypothetical protein
MEGAQDHFNEDTTMLIKKYSGEFVAFDESKLHFSLQRSGANEETIQKVISRVKEELTEGKSTQKIYSEAFKILKRLSRSSAARYNLKQSIMQLGPSGFPFEKYIGEIFKYQDYEVQTNLTFNGKCVAHEVDVLAEKNNTIFVTECKFHNRQGVKSDVKVAMYFKSRVIDIAKGNQYLPEFKGKEIVGMLATNTRFTADAIVYCKCENIKLISWDYPQNGSLKDRIEISGLYPVTCLTSLKRREKQILLDEGIVLGKTLKERPELLNQFNFSNFRKKNINQELNELCFHTR